MKILYIDTSSETLLISLDTEKTFDCIKLENIKEHSIYAVEKVREILDKNNIEAKDLDKIVVVNGPGSFTGLRIGVTIAKTMAFVLNKNISVASSLKNKVIGYTGYDYYVSMIKDKKNKNYYGIYNKNYDTIYEGLTTEEEIKNKLNELNGNYLFIDNDYYNVEAVIKYSKDQPNINPHTVNPRYLKEVI